jgi:hypothetical protein
MKSESRNRGSELRGKGTSLPAHWRRGGLLPVVALAGMGVAGCTDQIPTSSDPGLIPVDAETFVVELPFAEFATDFRVDGGYGSARNLPAAILALGGPADTIAEASGGLGSQDLSVSRALFQWGSLPATVNVPPAGGGTTVSDSVWTVVGGELILRIDSARFSGAEEFEVRASALPESFDPATASWTNAVDTLGNRRAWTVPGGGSLAPLGEVSWLPSLGDSVIISLDSAQALALADRSASTRGVALETTTQGAYLRVFDSQLRLRVRPSSRPDTTVFVSPGVPDFTTIQSASVETGPDRVLVGGAPAFRTSFRMNLPATVEASGPACGGPPTCQVELTPDRLVYAALVLQTRAAPAATLAPADTASVDLRPVLAPELLPRAPLGVPASVQPRRIPPTVFRFGSETRVEVGLTRYIRDLIREPDPEAAPIPNTLSLVSTSEPSGLGVATFAGPAAAQGAPRLRLILTRSDGVSLP